jgi:hypothetical protein
MKKKFTRSNALAMAMLWTLATALGCGGKVEGNTYEDNGGVVKIEFKSGGKAYVSTGPATNTCSYAENGKTVILTCEGDKTAFTVDDDGALNGPARRISDAIDQEKVSALRPTQFSRWERARCRLRSLFHTAIQVGGERSS